MAIKFTRIEPSFWQENMRLNDVLEKIALKFESMVEKVPTPYNIGMLDAALIAREEKRHMKKWEQSYVEQRKKDDAYIGSLSDRDTRPCTCEGKGYTYHEKYTHIADGGYEWEDEAYIPCSCVDGKNFRKAIKSIMKDLSVQAQHHEGNGEEY